jgi:hypothetical protein
MAPEKSRGTGNEIATHGSFVVVARRASKPLNFV